MENFQIFDQNHGLTPLEKSQFLTVVTSFFYSLIKLFSFLENHQTHFAS